MGDNAPTPDSLVAGRFVPADPSRFCSPGDAASETCSPLSSPRPIGRVVIHTLAVPSTPRRSGVEAVIAAWQEPAGDHVASAHYLVDRDGTITQMVRESDVAFHAGNKDVNRNSIGIEHADICNDPAPYTVELYEHSAALVRDIAGRYGFQQLDMTTVFGHDSLGNHDDPGPYWDWEYYFQLLQWDGSTESTRPLRLAAMAAEQSEPPPHWREETRRQIPNDFCATRNDPYGARYWQVDLSEEGTEIPPDYLPATFIFKMNDPGLYKVSLWWPKFSDAIVTPNAPIDIDVKSDIESLHERHSVDQRASFGQWNDVGPAFNVTFAPATVTVEIGRNPEDLLSGTILADAVRLLRIG